MFYQSSPVPVLLYAEVVASLRMQKEVLERAFFGLSVLYKVQTVISWLWFLHIKDDCKVMYSCEYFRTKPKFMFFFSNPNSKTISFIEINNLIKNLLMLLLIKLSQNTRTLIFCQTSKNVGSYCITCHFSTCTCSCYKWSGVKTHQITFLLHVPYCKIGSELLFID